MNMPKIKDRRFFFSPRVYRIFGICNIIVGVFAVQGMMMLVGLALCTIAKLRVEKAALEAQVQSMSAELEKVDYPPLTTNPFQVGESWDGFGNPR